MHALATAYLYKMISENSVGRLNVMYVDQLIEFDGDARKDIGANL
jgi:hypothetical protein